jgi:general secretion pathway protein L
LANRSVAENPVSLLRIFGSLLDQADRCEWVLLDDHVDHGETAAGSGAIAELPKSVSRVQLVLPAAEVLLTTARLPRGAKRRTGSVLAFAVEEKTATDPDANQVSWLGLDGQQDALAVVDKAGLERWHKALETVGIQVDEVHSEILLLPIEPDEWSVAWNGGEGFVRNGRFAGAAMDSGDWETPPLLLRMMLDEANTAGTAPTAIAIYVTRPEAQPDTGVWQKKLGIDVRIAGAGDWRSAPAAAGVSLTQPPRRWRIVSGAARRLRPAALILGGALALHAFALVTDWTLLADDQRTLRQGMETQFRSAFPDAVAVVDPALQMHRKLVEARRNAGIPDSADFLPMLGQVAAATKELPSGALRAVAYESGRITLEVAAPEESTIERIVAMLRQAGLNVDRAAVTNRAGRSTHVLTVRTS